MTFKHESYLCSSWEFNWLQYFDVSVLMPFPYSLKWELKLKTAEVGHCNLPLWNFFGNFWMTNSRVFCGNLFLWLREPLISSLVFAITLVDRLNHFLKFWTVSPTLVASPIPQKWKIIYLNCREVRFRFDFSSPACLRTQPGQTCRLFCTFELIRNPFWPNGLFMPPPLHTPTLQSCPKFGSAWAEASILTDMQNLHLLQYSIINTVTEYQNSIHGCFLLLESNLDLWDGNRCFTDRLLKYLIARAAKKFA